MDQSDETLRQHLICMITSMGYIVVPATLYERALELLPEVADKIVKSERIPVR